MFRRLVFDDSAAVFTVVAFVTAVTIFSFAVWRALRMSRPQVDRFAHLPFNAESTDHRHDHSA